LPTVVCLVLTFIFRGVEAKVLYRKLPISNKAYYLHLHHPERARSTQDFFYLHNWQFYDNELQ